MKGGFKNDTDIDARIFAEMIIEKLNYSYEDFKRELGFDKRVSFSFQDYIYHINELLSYGISKIMNSITIVLYNGGATTTGNIGWKAFRGNME